MHATIYTSVFKYVICNDILITADNTTIRIDINKQMRVCIYSIMLYFSLHVSTRMSHLQVFIYRKAYQY
jgi:hypothetical protein